MKIFICNHCSKAYCWQGEYNDMQCPNCRSEELTTDECMIASLINILSEFANDNIKKILGDKND